LIGSIYRVRIPMWRRAESRGMNRPLFLEE
jgi:hypothetical protein